MSNTHIPDPEVRIAVERAFEEGRLIDYAIAEIQRLSLSIAKGATWIPVSERLPETPHADAFGHVSGDVVVKFAETQFPQLTIAIRSFTGEFAFRGYRCYTPTHWYPIPSLPEAEK